MAIIKLNFLKYVIMNVYYYHLLLSIIVLAVHVFNPIFKLVLVKY